MLKLILVFVAIFLIATITYTSSIFTIKDVIVFQNQKCLNEENILEESNVEGKNIFVVKEENVAAQIKSKYPCIKNLTVNKSYPSKLEFKVEVAEIIVKIEGTNFFLTEEGFIRELSDFKNKPTLYLKDNIDLNPDRQITDQTVLFALKVAAGLSKSDFSLANIRIIDPVNIVAYNQQDLITQFTSTKQADEQVDSLQLVLSKAKIDGTKIAKIDLRFDKPVIVYK